MSNFRDFRSKNKLKGTSDSTNFVDFGAGDVGKGSLNKIIDNAKKNGTLNLANRNLEEIPQEVYNINNELSKPNKSIDFDANNERWWHNVFLTKLIISTNLIKNVGDEITLLNKLTYLDLSDNKISNLPSSICSLVLLRYFNISKNDISLIPSDLGQMNILQNFICSHNRIKEIPDLGTMDNLEVLDISNNSLSEFPCFITNLQSLRKLDLNHNLISSMPIVTKKPQALRFIDLSYNKLVNFSDESYLNLEQLYLHVNQLDSFPITCLHAELKELSLSQNHIKMLSDTVISYIPNISTLSISNNRFTELSDKIGELKMLANLDLSNNELNSLPFSLGYMSSLKSLTISGNPLRGMKRSVLEAGAEVIKEYLRTRNTTEVEEPVSGLGPGAKGLGRVGANSELSGLNQSDLRATGVVRLSARGITQLSDDIFASLQSVTVKEFILNKNKFTEFPTRILEYKESLLDLDLSSNMLSEIPASIEALCRLRRLDISHNQVKTLPHTLGFLGSLSHLVLSYNALGSCIPEVVYVCKGLQTLSMVHCGLQSLDAAKIATMSSLEVLDVSNNDISSVPPELGLCDKIKTLSLDGNSFKVPRLALLAKGTVAVMEYLRSRIATQ